MKTIAITRKQLYQELWTEATTHVARRYGLSDVGMAKLCRKHNIPRPPRGHWAKKRFGKTSPQIPLPDVESDVTITLRDPSDSQTASPSLNKEIQQQAAREHQKAAKIEVADNLRGSHALVSKANQELSRATTDENRLIVPAKDATLDIRVTKDNLRRSLLIMDALIKVLEERDMPVSAGPKVQVRGVSLSFGISESLKILREQPEEYDLDGTYQFGHSRFETKRVPSGILTLRINEAEQYWATGCRQSWRDGKKQRLEGCLNKVIAGLLQLAAQRKVHKQRMEREAEERRVEEARRQEERRIRVEKIERKKAESAKLDVLHSQAEAWKKSQNLREFIEAARRHFLAENGRIEPESELAVWLDWAVQHADRLDPLIDSPPSILDEVIEEEPQRHRW